VASMFGSDLVSEVASRSTLESSKSFSDLVPQLRAGPCKIAPGSRPDGTVPSLPVRWSEAGERKSVVRARKLRGWGRRVARLQRPSTLPTFHDHLLRHNGH
jgi:hypothetical protein